MTTLYNSKTTKTELQSIINRLQSQEDCITRDQIINLSKKIWFEVIEAIRDTYRLGCWTRKQYSAIRDYVAA